MAIEKAKNVNLLLAPSLWKRLLAVAGPLGQSRAAFIRVVLEQAAYSKDPGAYMPRAAQSFVTATQPRAELTAAPSRPAPTPEPEYIAPIPACPRKHIVPDHWVNRYGHTFDRQQDLDDDQGLDYWPPEQAPAPVPYVDWFAVGGKVK